MKTRWTLNLALLLALAEVVLLVGTQAFVFGSPAGAWAYGYISAFRLDAFLFGICLGVALAILLRVTRRLLSRSEAGVILLWLGAGFAGQLLLHSLYIYSIGDIVRHPYANTFYDVSGQFGIYDLLSNYLQRVASLPLHIKANMPGKVVFYQLLRLVTPNITAMGLIVLALSDLGGCILYLLARDLYGEGSVPLATLALYLFIPSKLYFLPLLNIVSVIPVLAAMLLMLRALRSRSSATAVLFGSLLYLSIFFDPLPLALGLFFVAILVREAMRERLTVSELLRLGLVSAAGLIIPGLTMAIFLHFDTVGGLSHIFEDSRAFNLSQNRPYLVWLWADLVEFFFNAGALSSLVCLVYAAIAIGSWFARESPRTENDANSNAPGVMALTLLFITIAVLDLTGINRGEVVRLWIFITPLLQMVAADFCENISPAASEILLFGNIVQTAVTISMVGFIL